MDSDAGGSDILLAMGIEVHDDNDSRCESDIVVEHSDYVASHQDETIDILEAMGVAHVEACDVVRRASSDGKPDSPNASSLHMMMHHYHPSLRTIQSVGNMQEAGGEAEVVPPTWLSKMLDWVSRLFK